MNADGSDIKPLTEAGGNSLAPEWSPDGRRILFHRDLGRPEDKGICEMDPDGSNVRQLTSGYADTEPTWSPDGARIAFKRGDNLFVMNVDGSDPRVLTSGVDWEGDLTWSPDGKSIVFGIKSASKICYYDDFEEYTCGRDLKRVGLDGVIDPAWELLSAFNLVWQR
jgi:Tol biopolymer transport system component